MDKALGRLATDAEKAGEWHQTPPWHWRYWFGYRMRHLCQRRIGLFVNGVGLEWEYRTFGQHARAILEEQANGRSENLTAEEIDRRINSGRKHSPHWYT